MDPAWVGAWWMGFVVTAIGFLLVTFPLFGYPTNLPGLHPDYLLNCPTYLECRIVDISLILFILLFSGTKHIREERKTEADREREERKNNDKRPLKEKLLDFPKALLVLVCKKYNVKLT